jgi:glucoamylase
MLVSGFSARADQGYAWDPSQAATQPPAAIAFMMANISIPGAAPGSVTAASAATSADQPDYSYNWIRDSAITMDQVLSLYQQGAAQSSDQATYYQRLLDYVSFSRQLQLTPNPSGAADDLGLGEPKFNLDGSAYEASWGRPQNDGPALRAVTLIRFANQLLSENDATKAAYVRQSLYDGQLPSNSVIKNDLEYVAHHWQDPSFDLWEEIEGTHFFTQMVQRRAMVDGAALASALGDVGAAEFYQEQATALDQAIQQHWDPSRGILVETINLVSGFDKPSGLDSAVVLGALRGATSDRFMSVTDDEVFATAEKLRQSFASLYPINQTVQNWDGQPIGTGIGRYPEDTFNGSPERSGGNPWFLTTLGFAEFYYQCANLWQADQQIVISATNGPILAALPGYSGGALSPGETVLASDSRFAGLIAALRAAGDGEFSRALYHAANDGSMSEEFDRDTGFMTSAPNLTWSYAAFLSALQ